LSGPRIYELSKELSITNKDVMEFLQSKGISFKSHSSSVDIADAQLVRKHFNKLAEQVRVAAAEKEKAEKAKKAAAKAAPPLPPPREAPHAPPAPPHHPAQAAPPAPLASAAASPVTPLAPRLAPPAVPAHPPVLTRELPHPPAPPPRFQPPPPPARAPAPPLARHPGPPRPFVPRRPPPHRFRPAGPGHRPHRKHEGPAKGAATAVLEPVDKGPARQVTVTEGVTVKEFAERVDIKAKDVIKALLDKGIFVSINHSLDAHMIGIVSPVLNLDVEIVPFEKAARIEAEQVQDVSKLATRPPVVTIMGHVDHGKTSLLDAIRSTNVAGMEAGGITQRIGAYTVPIKNRSIVFLDTPGHEAFTKMRARGARVTDIVVLVVAADDGVMPQTVEAIHHAKAANVPIIAAINKIDKPGADAQRVRRELADQDLVAEEWGGQTIMVEVSAKKQVNLDALLEMILLVADMAELKSAPERRAAGTVLEARLDKGRGPVATVLVQSGTLGIGDNVLVGATFGKVRAMINDVGDRVKKAGPSTPVEVQGIVDVPQPGDQLQAVDDLAKARQIGSFRQMQIKESRMVKPTRLTLDHLFQQISEGAVKELPMVLKADVQGSVEVLAGTLNKLSTEKVRIRIIHSGVGAITETDVLLASASNAVIIGFNVRPERKATDLARTEEVDIRLHTVIYNITDEIKNAMLGLLEPTYKEIYLGTAEVRNTFKVPKVGTVAGCFVTEGKVTRTAECRLIRDNVVIFEGKISSLRRFKDDASEVKVGLECGIGIERFGDVKVGDVIEAFLRERMKQDLGEALKT